jgi:hypothetical protein
MKAQLSNKDWELLSAYLDGKLSTSDRERLEGRLRSSQILKDALVDLRVTHHLLRQLPRKKIPHHFNVTRAMLPRRSPWAVPLSLGFSLASATSLALIILTFAVQLLPSGAPAMQSMSEAASVQVEDQATAPLIIWGTPGSSSAPALGMGGGGAADTTAFGMGGGGQPVQGGIGGGAPETAMATQPPPALVLPSAEEAAPAAEKEQPAPTATVTVTADMSMQAAPTMQAPQEGTGQVLQATAVPQAPNPADNVTSPILGIPPVEERGVEGASAAATDNYRLQQGSVRGFLDAIQTVVWVRFGLVILGMGSAAAAVYFIRKTRL